VANRLLIDTGAFIALFDSRDDLHEAATSFYRSVPGDTLRLTTEFVVGETYTFFRYRLGTKLAMAWLDYLDEARQSQYLRIEYATRAIVLKAESLLRRFSDQAMSYTDAVTLAWAEQNNVQTIFGFDHQLALTGLTVVPGPTKRKRVRRLTQSYAGNLAGLCGDAAAYVEGERSSWP